MAVMGSVPYTTKALGMRVWGNAQGSGTPLGSTLEGPYVVYIELLTAAAEQLASAKALPVTQGRVMPCRGHGRLSDLT